MKPTPYTLHSRLQTRRTRGGQTLIIALILLGVLLIIGFVFLGVVNQNILSSNRSHKRSVATDLADSGVRFAHSQLLTSALGADWQVAQTPLDPSGFTRDPDALYLRPGTKLGLRNAGDPQLDLGGPDGLGFYSRVNFEQGRSLVRVRYAPSDFNMFSTAAFGPLRNPGKARNYLIIESIGRPGVVNPNDPTTLNTGGSIQYANFLTWTDFETAFQALKDTEKNQVQSKKTIAFASIGIIESARYVTDLYRQSKPAELGSPNELGVVFRLLFSDPAIVPNAPMQLGSNATLFKLGNPPTLDPNPVPSFGSLYSNADLLLYGPSVVNENTTLGDQFDVAGILSGNDATASLTINRSAFNVTWQTAATTLTNATNPSMSSRSGNFGTVGGSLRDGIDQTDSVGYPRGASYKTPPSILTVNPETGENRYVLSTRESGFVTSAGGNSGFFGHGRGVYVNNGDDLQIPATEDGRMDSGSAASLVYDWLNPNNGQSNSGWQGAYYVPRGSYVQLLSDGFIIRRDSRAPKVPIDQLYWKGPDGQEPHDKSGTLVDSTVCRYRLGPGADGRLHVINTFTPDPNNAGKAIDVDALAPNFDAGPDFNGVLYFAGNVRVRGVIPTDIQLSLVSGGSIYIEGSITKGIVDAGGARLNRPSRSMLMLMAKDYVVLNTTQFMGPAPWETLESVDDEQTTTGFNSIRMRVPSGSLDFRTEFLVDPSTGTANNPQTWTPYALGYQAAGGNQIFTKLLLTQATDSGPAPATFVSLDVNLNSTGSSAYQFALDNQDPGGFYFKSNYYNTALNFYPAGTLPGSYGPIYGLGGQAWQVFSKFESQVFPLVTNAMTYNAGSTRMSGAAGNKFGQYSLLLQDTNDFLIRPNLSLMGSAQNNYVAARTAVVPADIRIEASMYAEQGSFFVIPGPWFNPNPNDTRDSYTKAVNDYVTLQGLNQADATAAAQRDRIESYGSYPEMPFYQEPIDARINIVGSVSENMPPPISQQAEWLKHWGWIPRVQGATGVSIPTSHFPPGYNPLTSLFVPNLIFTYDPALATGRPFGFDNTNVNQPFGSNVDIGRTDGLGRPLPPMPRLPVSPTLAYFGEVTP